MSISPRGAPRGHYMHLPCLESLNITTAMAAPQDKNVNEIEQEIPFQCVHASYHTDFSSLEAEIVLQSAEGTLYRIHAYTLRTTSAFFRTMLSLPPPKTPHRNEPIPIHQPDVVVEPLFRLMCGLPVHPWQSYDEMEAVLALAENWDIPCAVSSIRAALAGHRWLTVYPLRFYALATHFGWAAEVQLASQHTLSLNLFDPIHEEVLHRLSAKALLPLLALHRSRREGLRELLDSPERFLAGNGEPFHCSACAITPLDNRTWRALKHRIVLEMDCRPLGDTLGVAVGGMGEWAEAKACWASKCTKVDCGAANYDRVATLKQIRVCVDSLPVAVVL